MGNKRGSPRRFESVNRYDARCRPFPCTMRLVSAGPSIGRCDGRAQPRPALVPPPPARRIPPPFSSSRGRGVVDQVRQEVVGWMAVAAVCAAHDGSPVAGLCRRCLLMHQSRKN